MVSSSTFANESVTPTVSETKKEVEAKFDLKEIEVAVEDALTDSLIRDLDKDIADKLSTVEFHQKVKKSEKNQKLVESYPEAIAKKPNS